MADRSVKVTLRANVQDFKNQIGQAATSLDDLAKKGDKTGQASQTLMGKVTQSMQHQREAWTTAGTALTVMGTAITGVGVAALTTGINYNTLQQTSRAALESITGSAEAANRQMDKLDAFASTSPFAKDVFIRAQQQMLGFGIEAQKVIPYLDAIQNAVAATGGSNHDVAELSRIFSQISASAKITATDLREFGNRGVDAATIIGTQMGFTGAEIREQITAGTLDAGDALDALASGMMVTYENAADNVKNTITGSFDRVKAAWRDLSGDLAAPLVGPDGGGLLVGLLNQVADLMRAFQGLPDPVKNTVAALGGLAGVGSLAAGGFLLLAPRVMDSVVAFKALRDLNLVAMAGGLSGVAASIAKFALPVAAFAGVMALHQALNGISEGDYGDVDALADALLDVADGGTTASDALTLLGTTAGQKGLFTNEITNMTELLDDLGPAFEKAFGDSTWNKVERFMDAPGDPVGKANEKIRMLDESLASLVASGNAGEAAEQYSQIADTLIESGLSAEEAADKFGAYHEELAVFLASGGELKGVVSDWERIRDILGDGAPMQLPDGSTVWNYADATGEAADETERLASVSQTARDVAERLGVSEETLTGIYDQQERSIRGVIDARYGLNNEARTAQELEVAWAKASEGMVKALEDESVALNASKDGWNLRTDAGQQAFQSSKDYADIMRDTALAEWDRTGSLNAVNNALEPIADEYREQAEALGLNGAALEAYMAEMMLLPEQHITTLTVDTEDFHKTIEGVWTEFDKETMELRVDGEVTPLLDTVAGTLGLIADRNGEVTIDGETYPAEMTWLEFLALMGSEDAIIDMAANDAEARAVLDTLMNDVDQSYDEVGVGADTSQGTKDVDTLLTNTRGKSASISVNANTLNFQNAVAGLIGRTVGTAYVNLSPRTSASVYASGGYVSGPGTATSDSIPAWLSNGEYVIKANSVAKYGKSFFDQLNAGRYAQGGYVSARSATAPVVNVSAPSMEGMQLTGSLQVGDALVPIIDGRIVAADRKKQIVGRRP